MICLRFLTSYSCWLGLKMSLKPSVCVCSVSVSRSHAWVQSHRYPFDSTHNQEKNIKPQEKSISRSRNCIRNLYMLETVFNFLHGDLLYVSFGFASNPIFYRKKAIPIVGLLIRCAVKCYITVELRYFAAYGEIINQVCIFLHM